MDEGKGSLALLAALLVSAGVLRADNSPSINFPLPLKAAQTKAVSAASCPYADKMADAIYKAEGGANTKHPYGVKSVSTTDARKTTLVSINNNWKRWQQAGSKGDFVDFMANRWCPVVSDPVGNKNWKVNVKKMLLPYRSESFYA